MRTLAEFTLDHVPHAINRPVLSEEERARVGTLYKQVSAFTAKKLGAALVARNIALHIETHFLDKPKGWRPLIYCWRGGKRSAAMTHVLREIGWDAHQLTGGYREYRRSVVAQLPELTSRFRWQVICGLTGVGKSRLLQALSRQGAQVLDLERLAVHRGSVLGSLPQQAQPSQKMFESLLWHTLRGLDPARAVYVESESKRIGQLRVPEELITAMWASECVQVRAALPLRVQLLQQEYKHFLHDAAALETKLDCLVSLHGHATVEHWKTLMGARRWDELVGELLVRHYDPAYMRSIVFHYPELARARAVQIVSLLPEHFDQAARWLTEESQSALSDV